MLQFPRAFLLAGPVTWVLKLTLFLQIFREHNPLITWPDDPLALGEWFNSLDMSNWHMVVAPNSFLNEMASGVVWGILISRMGNWHDAAHQMLEDAELSVRCDRWLTGDPAPWDGANPLRHGTLIISIVDKSGVYIGTSHGGTIFDGLARTAVEFMEDFIDSTVVLLEDADVPADYYESGNRLTHKELPYVVFREGETSPIQTSAWINSPAKGVQVLCGGHSMPGINETISATIQFVGDAVGGLLQIGSFGGSIDTLVKPLYEDTILAWWAVKHFSRAQNSGWERLFEYFQEGASKAYTIACVAGDTLIDSPDGKERIDVLAERGDPFSVWSITERGERVPATALMAFRKGYAELFEYTLANGLSIKATREHRWLTRTGWEQTGTAQIGTEVNTEYGFSAVVSIRSAGMDDFYDMHVPVLENYLAQGIWNHNSLMVLRAGFWATRTVISWKVQVVDGVPFMIGDRHQGHFFLDDRVGLVLEGDTAIHMDRCRKIDLAWEEDKPQEWQITIGDDRILEDPAQRAWGKIEALVAGLRDLGVW